MAGVVGRWPSTTRQADASRARRRFDDDRLRGNCGRTELPERLSPTRMTKRHAPVLAIRSRLHLGHNDRGRARTAVPTRTTTQRHEAVPVRHLRLASGTVRRSQRLRYGVLARIRSCHSNGVAPGPNAANNIRSPLSSVRTGPRPRDPDEVATRQSRERRARQQDRFIVGRE